MFRGSSLCLKSKQEIKGRDVFESQEINLLNLYKFFSPFSSAKQGSDSSTTSSTEKQMLWHLHVGSRPERLTPLPFEIWNSILSFNCMDSLAAREATDSVLLGKSDATFSLVPHGIASLHLKCLKKEEIIDS